MSENGNGESIADIIKKIHKMREELEELEKKLEKFQESIKTKQPP